MKDNKSYGWRLLIGSFLILVIDGGVRFSFGVLIKPLAAEFSWERGTITFAYTLNMLVFACCQPLAGKLLDRFGPRRLFSVSALIAAAGLVLTSQTTSLSHLYCFYGIATAAGTSGISIGVVSAVLSRRFKSLRVFVSGVAISGTALGQFLVIPMLALLLEHWGWRSTWAVLGALVALVIIPVSLFAMTDPFQDDAAFGVQVVGRGEQFSDAAALSVYRVLFSGNFLLVGATYFICGFQDFLLVTQLIPFATDRGLAAQAASNLQGLAGLLSIAGLLVSAAGAERFGRKIPLLLTFLPRLVCFAMLVFFDGAAWIYASALLFGFTLMASAPLTAVLVGELYGFKHVGTLSGVVFWLHHLGGALGAYAGGSIYDSTRSYQAAFGLALILACVAVVTTVSIRLKVPRAAG